MTSEAASQTNPKGFSLADVFKPFQIPISKVTSSDLLKALGKFLPVCFQKGVNVGISGCPYHIGDFAQGGVIIFLTHDGMHGLVAAIDDALTEVEWSINPAPTTATNNDPLPYTTPSAPHGQYYGGYKNQQAIQGITNWATIYPAFAAAADYSITVNGVKYDDWWLPSSTELSLMYAFRGVINQVSVANGGSVMTKIATYTYWSSREDDNFNAWGLIFSDGTQSNTFGKNYKNAIRCVRAF